MRFTACRGAVSLSMEEQARPTEERASLASQLADAFPGPSLFEHDDGWRALQAILEQEPERLLGCCARFLKERALLLDPERLCRAAVPYVAASAPGSGPKSFGEWVVERLDEAAGILQSKDEMALEHGDPCDEDAHALLSRTLLVPAAHALRASVRFNGLNHETRMAFFRHILDRRSLPGPPERDQAVRHLQLALNALYVFREGEGFK